MIATGSEVGIAAEAVRSGSRQGTQGAAGLDAEHHDLRPPGRGLQGERAAGRRSRAAWRWRRAYASRGGAMSGLKGQIVGIDHFGASAPAKELFKQYGFTPEHVVQAIDKVFDELRLESQGAKTMAIKVGINGYGRIGRNILRALYEGKHGGEIKIVAINDLGDANTNAHLTRFDTVHGRFHGDVHVDGDSMVVNGDRINVVAQRDPSKLPWRELGVDFVLECTGLFTSKAKASAHLTAGAKKVLISAPGGDDVDATVVYGVNHQTSEGDRYGDFQRLVHDQLPRAARQSAARRRSAFWPAS